jgi:hypothetical protein
MNIRYRALETPTMSAVVLYVSVTSGIAERTAVLERGDRKPHHDTRKTMNRR